MRSMGEKYLFLHCSIPKIGVCYHMTQLFHFVMIMTSQLNFL